jgi:hypothetical protein
VEESERERGSEAAVICGPRQSLRAWVEVRYTLPVEDICRLHGQYWWSGELAFALRCCRKVAGRAGLCGNVPRYTCALAQFFGIEAPQTSLSTKLFPGDTIPTGAIALSPLYLLAYHSARYDVHCSISSRPDNHGMIRW